MGNSHPAAVTHPRSARPLSTPRTKPVKTGSSKRSASSKDGSHPRKPPRSTSTTVQDGSSNSVSMDQLSSGGKDGPLVGNVRRTTRTRQRPSSAGRTEKHRLSASKPPGKTSDQTAAGEEPASSGKCDSGFFSTLIDEEDAAVLGGMSATTPTLSWVSNNSCSEETSAGGRHHPGSKSLDSIAEVEVINSRRVAAVRTPQCSMDSLLEDRRAPRTSTAATAAASKIKKASSKSGGKKAANKSESKRPKSSSGKSVKPATIKTTTTTVKSASIKTTSTTAVKPASIKTNTTTAVKPAALQQQQQQQQQYKTEAARQKTRPPSLPLTEPPPTEAMRRLSDHRAAKTNTGGPWRPGQHSSTASYAAVKSSTQPRPRCVNDDHLYPNAITPSKLKHCWSSGDALPAPRSQLPPSAAVVDELLYDVPFMDDEIFFVDNWYQLPSQCEIYIDDSRSSVRDEPLCQGRGSSEDELTPRSNGRPNIGAADHNNSMSTRRRKKTSSLLGCIR